jgi:hypothetical protein
MPPKLGPTRTALDGTIEQFCTKCHLWKDQQSHFYSKLGTRIVALCQKCRDDIKPSKVAALSLALPERVICPTKCEQTATTLLLPC